MRPTFMKSQSRIFSVLLGDCAQPLVIVQEIAVVGARASCERVQVPALDLEEAPRRGGRREHHDRWHLRGRGKRGR